GKGLEVDPSTPIREIARSNGVSPYQLVKEILKTLQTNSTTPLTPQPSN
ncbi:MAG: hypothetical protein GXO13_05950, partial [Epsilonproteobacteria bacterium]|nr:hypothetical protein [Campylobacterota bacterium]